MLVAVTKTHHNVTAIAVLNLLSGVPALAWLFLAVASPLGSMLDMQALEVAFLMCPRARARDRGRRTTATPSQSWPATTGQMTATGECQ